LIFTRNWNIINIVLIRLSHIHIEFDIEIEFEGLILCDIEYFIYTDRD